MQMKYYISITGLKVKSIWRYPQFWIHAVPSAIQAQSATGIVEARTTYRNGIQHTLTVWEDRKFMLRYLRGGAHLKAMKVTDQVSEPNSTKVYGYESDTIPTWEEAIKLWDVYGTRHGKLVPSVKQNSGGIVTSRLDRFKSSLFLIVFAIATAWALTSPSGITTLFM